MCRICSQVERISSTCGDNVSGTPLHSLGKFRHVSHTHYMADKCFFELAAQCIA